MSDADLQALLARVAEAAAGADPDIVLEMSAIVRVHVSLTKGAITKIVVQPEGQLWCYDNTDHDQDECQQAIAIADESVWGPLLHLPEGLEWQT